MKKIRINTYTVHTKIYFPGRLPIFVDWHSTDASSQPAIILKMLPLFPGFMAQCLHLLNSAMQDPRLSKFITGADRFC
jgi:hypothetical protein